MPAKSKAQFRLMAACAHGASYENCPEMTSSQFQDYIRSGSRNLPEHVSKSKSKRSKKKAKAST